MYCKRRLHILHKHILYKHTAMDNIQKVIKSTATTISVNANELLTKTSTVTNQLITTAALHTQKITSTLNESATQAYHTTVQNNAIKQQQRRSAQQDKHDILHAYDPDDDPKFVKYLQQETQRVGEKLPKLQYPVVLVHGFIGHDYVFTNPLNGKRAFEYFGTVRAELEEAGIVAIAPQLPRLASIYTRSNALATALGLRPITESSQIAHATSTHVRSDSDRLTKQSRTKTMKPTSSTKMNDLRQNYIEMTEMKKKATENLANSDVNHDQEPNKPNDNNHHKPDITSLSSSPDTLAARNNSTATHTTPHISGEPNTQQNDNEQQNDDHDMEVLVVGADNIDLSTYKGKFNLICHSMGGLDARQLATHFKGASERIASITTFVTPHRGSSIADLVLQTISSDPFSAAQLVVRNLQDPTVTSTDEVRNSWDGTEYATLSQLSIRKICDLLGIDTDGLRDLARDAVDKFNALTPSQPNIKYYSVGSHKQLTPFNPMYMCQRVLNATEGCNDGLVSVKSAVYGHYLYTADLDHIESVGLGITNRHLHIFRALIRYLHNENL